MLPRVVSGIGRAGASSVCRRRGACLRFWRCQRRSARDRHRSQHDCSGRGRDREKAPGGERADPQARRGTQSQARFRCLPVVRSGESGCLRYAGRPDADSAVDLQKPAAFVPGVAPEGAPRMSACGDCLRELGYSLQANRKIREGGQHMDRNAQFQYLNDQATAFLKAQQPGISVDTKKGSAQESEEDIDFGAFGVVGFLAHSAGDRQRVDEDSGVARLSRIP